MDLRPLGFGEIFDRAVTLYIRNIVPFIGIVMVLILPLSILQYILDRSSQPQLDMMIKVLQNPEHAKVAHVPTILDSPASVAVLLVLLFITYLFWPFALNAVAVGVARLYRNRRVEFRACYEAVLSRWPQIIGLLFVQFLAFLAWYVAVVVIVLAIVVIVIALGAASSAFAFWFGFVAGLAGIVIMAPLLAPLAVSLVFAMYSAVIEQCGVGESLRRGFTRVFNRTEFWRSLLFALAAGGVVLGGSMMLGMLGLLAAFAHQPALEAIVESLARATLAPFGVVLLAIYYFDVRIRREAFDLENSLDRLTGAQPA
ncbi:MAG TPA: hypothetical protein VHX17_05540 [Candidatus Cybelea sp.]|nr:hypothetical protein [Candidatus Cybelea sp.]